MLAFAFSQRELTFWQTKRTVNVTRLFTNKTHVMAQYSVMNTALRPESYLQGAYSHPSLSSFLPHLSSLLPVSPSSLLPPSSPHNSAQSSAVIPHTTVSQSILI